MSILAPYIAAFPSLSRLILPPVHRELQSERPQAMVHLADLDTTYRTYDGRVSFPSPIHQSCSPGPPQVSSCLADIVCWQVVGAHLSSQ